MKVEALKNETENSKSPNTLLIIDPSLAGISGYMVVAALVNLLGTEGNNQLIPLEHAITKIDKEFQLTIEKTKRGALAATLISIHFGKMPQLRHPEYLRRSIFQVLAELGASTESKTFCERTLNALLGAEAKVHGEQIEAIHLHEIGSVDTIFAICAAALLLDAIKCNTKLEIFSLPVSVGGGFIEAAHGRLPIPSPAATQIAKEHNFLLRGGPTNHELMTPTGAAILAGLQPQFLEHLPLFCVTGIGVGGGMKDFRDHPNILRILQGIKPSKWRAEELIVLETSVDDVTGEVLGFLVEKLMDLGAMDVSILPSVMKKNRPGHLIKVICDESQIDHLMTVMVKETGTLGIRVIPCQRIAVHRTTKIFQTEIAGQQMDITAKIAWLGDNIVSVKSEFSEIRKISERTGLPITYLQKRLDGEIYGKIGRKVPYDD